MSIDLSKLTPAPWRLNPGDSYAQECVNGPSPDLPILVAEPDSCDSDLEFAALARNAFDVMMRRGWHAYFDPAAQGWFLGGHHGHANAFSQSNTAFADPFTALVEADRWMSEKEKSDA